MNEPHPAVLGMIQGLKVDIKYQRRHFRLWHFASVSQDRLTSVIRATADVKRASLERRNDPERSLIIRWSSLALVGIVHLEVMANGRASLDEAAFAVSYRPARSFSKEDG